MTIITFLQIICYFFIYFCSRKTSVTIKKRKETAEINDWVTLGEKAYFRSPDLSAISKIPHFRVPFRRRVLPPFNPADGFPLRVY